MNTVGIYVQKSGVSDTPQAQRWESPIGSNAKYPMREMDVGDVAWISVRKSLPKHEAHMFDHNLRALVGQISFGSSPVAEYRKRFNVNKKKVMEVTSSKIQERIYYVITRNQ